jgi:hypothetical protein
VTGATALLTKPVSRLVAAVIGLTAVLTRPLTGATVVLTRPETGKPVSRLVAGRSATVRTLVTGALAFSSGAAAAGIAVARFTEVPTVPIVVTATFDVLAISPIDANAVLTPLPILVADALPLLAAFTTPPTGAVDVATETLFLVVDVTVLVAETASAAVCLVLVVVVDAKVEGCAIAVPRLPMSVTDAVALAA